jgi:inosine/xanthosine triphosphatase
MQEAPLLTPFRMVPSLEAALTGEVVRIGSENPAKCAALHKALDRLRPPGDDVPEIRVLPTHVSSGVPEQPIGFEQIVAGARHRARSALALGGCVLAVGIEDGLVPLADGSDAEGLGFFNVGSAWVTDGEREGSGFSSGFAYPPGCLSPAIRDREPIGDLFDRLWRATRASDEEVASGRGEGNIGKLTGGRLTRADYGAQAILCALVRFLHRDLYD